MRGLSLGLGIGLFLFVSGALWADGGSDPTYFDDWTLYAHAKAKIGGLAAAADGEDALAPHEIVYDDKGRIVEFYPYGKDGGQVQRFEYDNADRVTKIESQFRDSDSEDWQHISTTLYVYNPKGQLISRQFDDAAAQKATIDPKGNSVFTEDEDLSDGAKGLYTIILSPRLLVLEESFVETTKAGKKVLNYRNVHTYNTDGRRVKTDITQGPDPAGDNKEHKANITYTYVLDRQGNLSAMKVKAVSPDDSLYSPDLLTPNATFKVASDLSALKPGTPGNTPGGQGPGAAGGQGAGTQNPGGQSPGAGNPPPSQPKNVDVLYEGDWYPAVILQQKGDQFLIHYVDYDSSWDEWVTKDRIRPRQ